LKITIDSNLIAVLFATQLVFTLYGAGIRRPFGSLATISDLPPSVRRASDLTITVDLLFVAFLVLMWWFLITRMHMLQFLIMATVFGVIGHYLSHRIPLVPSFFHFACARCLLHLRCYAIRWWSAFGAVQPFGQISWRGDELRNSSAQPSVIRMKPRFCRPGTTF
jgi:hypothetical protein